MTRLFQTLLHGLGKRTFKYLTLFIVLAYFVLTLLYSLPVNPVRIAWHRLIILTVGSYFIQNWSLFAPNPVTSNKNLLILPLTDSTGQGLSAKGPLNWIDITQPLADNHHTHRLGPYERLSRAQKEAFHIYLGYSNYLYTLQRACNTGDSLACGVYRQQLVYDRNMAMNMFGRIGSSACNQLFPSDSITHYILAYKITYAVEWSKRYETIEHTYDFGIIDTFKIDRSVEKSIFFEHAK